LGGRQSVFLQPSQIVDLAKLYGFEPGSLQGLFDSAAIDQDTLRTRNSVSDFAYIQNLINMETFSFDATSYENPGRILDLNTLFDSQLETSEMNRFDGLFDGGCLDNVWNPAQSQMNLASLLRTNGRLINWVSASNWPNLSAEVWRFKPTFTRRADYDPFAAALKESSHPGFVLAIAEVGQSKAPTEWTMPMQSHYLGGSYRDWREDYEHSPGLPFAFDSEKSKHIPGTQPIDSDHYEYCGVLNGFA
jgi:hypothetical protein